MSDVSQSITQQPVKDLLKRPFINILLINAGKGTPEIVHWLHSKKVLKNVEQMNVRLEMMNKTPLKSDYINQITMLSALYKEGFRIFHLSRDPDVKCRYRLNGHDVTGCYTLSLMRCTKTQNKIVLPSKNEINRISNTDTALLYHNYALSTQVLCNDIVRVGDIDDGGWDVCNDTGYRPSDDCLVYSFGVAQDWTFDEEVSRRYGCEVHSFDPSIGEKDHKHSDKVWFHNLGLSNEDGNRGTWKMKTLDSIKRMLGHTNRILDFLKMDIEESEWPAISQMLTTGVLKNVRQLGVEIHSPNVTPGKHYASKLGILSQLYTSGFQLFWAHPNQRLGNQRRLRGAKTEVTVCYEIYYLNTKLKRTV